MEISNISDALFTAFTYLAMAVFYVGMFLTRKNTYSAIKGKDNRLDTKELPVYLWWWMFPILFFYTVLLVQSSIEITDNKKELVISLWGVIGVFTSFIIGQQALKAHKENSSE